MAKIEKLINDKEMDHFFLSLKKKNFGSSMLIENSLTRKNPFCNSLTSLARLIQKGIKGEQCVTLFAYGGTIYYSSNQNKQLAANHPIFSLKEQNYDSFLRFISRLIVSELKKVTKEIELLLVQEETEDLAEFLQSMINENWNGKSCFEIESQFTKIIATLQQVKEISAKLAAALFNCEIIIDDYQKTSAVFRNNCTDLHQELIKSIKELNLTFCASFSHQSKAKPVHCELRMFELICQLVSNGTISAPSFRLLQTEALVKNFTVSKFCCRLCYEVFNNIARTAEQKDWDLNILGNSGQVFLNWTSPSFVTEGLFTAVRETTENSLTALISSISSLAQQHYSSLENSALNQVENIEIKAEIIEL